MSAWRSYRYQYKILLLYLIVLHDSTKILDAEANTDATPGAGGPNVCRSRQKNYCCPGWKLRPGSNLCVLPVCWRLCGDGNCVKPNICLCENGTLGVNCSGKILPGPISFGDNVSTSSSCPLQCLNGGTCDNNTRKCICKSGYMGENCAEPVCKEACLNGGRCIGPDRCACVYGFAGRKCEADYRVGPCFRKIANDMCQSQLENVVCTKQLCCATIGRAWGHPCEHCPLQLDCPAGFLKNIHSGRCVDIDECEAIPDLCDGGKCLNTIGSFQCTCPAGRIRNALTNVCEDENECKSNDGRNICPHGRCVNTDGSYFCVCDNGYIPSHDRKHCLDAKQGKCYTTVNETKKCVESLPIRLSKIDCCCGKNMGKAWGDECEPCPASLSDEFKMLCIHDGTGGINGTSIMPVDECVLRPGICGGGKCIDTSDSFICDCYPGYQMKKSGDVQVCEDIDECNRGFCKGGQCLNAPGSFHCTCSPGFHASSDGKLCIDHDECAQNGMCANGVCINVEGSFKCRCNAGYILSSTGHACVDIDECLENPRICLNGRCLNSPGGYQCECQPGFTTTSDGGFCVDIDECSANNALCENGRCVNIDGSFRCVCNTGYHLSTNKSICIDFDECINSPCYNGKCVNTLGSFRCECPHGFVVGTDGRTCHDSSSDLCYAKYRDGKCREPSLIAISKSSCCCAESNRTMGWGAQCTPCPPAGSAEYSELCPRGTGMTFFGEDINECAQSPYICENGACENLMGTYRCICSRGYEPDKTGKVCVDINECDKPNLMCIGGRCENIPGDYQCVCPLGTHFNATTSVCEDVNECAEINICKNGKCINTFGSYICECPPNTILDGNGRVCLDNRRGSCWTKVISGRCENNLPKLTLKTECCCSVGLAWGSPCELCQTYQCNCTKGYAMLDGKMCSDINECDLNTNLCRGGGTCVNTEGSYLCVCPAGLTLDVTGTLCQDSRLDVCYADYKYGTGASPLEGVFSKSTCCCSTIGKAWGSMWRSERCPENTSSAFADLCPKGSGFVDRKDINECVEFPGICTNGRCKNALGNFSCTCNPGFTHNENGLHCLDIDECGIMSGVCGEAGDCRNTPGSFECKCNRGFESHPTMKTCVDINECVRIPNLCKAGNCVNDVGSYHCECHEGHELALDKQSCKDIDECSRTSGICSNGFCENMLGTYQCICEKGFQQTNGKSHCEDIDECTQNNGGCKDVCINTPGSYHCDCASGFFLLPDGYSCSDVDECAANPYICNGGDCFNSIGRYTCVCGPGLLPGVNDSVCLDINECNVTNRNLCGNGECVNTVGSFTCHCENGYSRKSEGNSSCVDNDECALDNHTCDKNAVCINNPGSYSCRCLDGFSGNGFACLDLNECLTNRGGCHKNAECVNTDGSFKCVCGEGFHGDGFTCTDIDECVENNIICENGYCINSVGSYRCECNMGYMNPVDKNQKSCIDINECDTFKELCTFGKCVNMMGKFRCDCDPGYQPDGTGGNCTDVNECDNPQVCMYGNCTNTEGSFSCTCPTNYQLADSKNACIDRRESRCYMSVEDRGNKRRCSMDTGSLLRKATCCCTVGKAWGGRCEPCPTSESDEFKLLCPGGSGYRPNATTVILEDVNECTDHANLCKNGHCTNTFGSYMCKCGDGFKLDSTGAFCNDIDECTETADICGIGFCVNDEGSYHCICPDGFMGMPNGKECVDTRKEKCYLNYSMSMCSEPMSNPQSRMICCCSMGQAWGLPCSACPAAGSKEYTQLCGSRPGQITNPLTNATEEIDECALMPAQICAHGRCVNTPGSFHCMCDPGYIYEDFSHQCIDENECLRTPNPCQGNSRCINNAGGFECQCPKGYKLGMHLNDCTDIDECAEQEGICMHGDCINLEGSFHCVCRNGYVLNTLRDRCVDFDECQRVSDVCRNGSCENVDGSYKCHCFEGFKLSHNNDCVDVDECAMMPHLCRNGRCLNTEGSFRCECVNGFTLTADGEHCKDVDECLEVFINLDGFNHLFQQGSSCLPPGRCQNVMGSYYCICPDGYRLTTNKTFCEDVNECEFPSVCRGGQCRNFDGGYNCTCPEGFTIGTAGTECIDTRRDNCYEMFSQGMCSNARHRVGTMKECCCSQGAAWGNRCERCPTSNTTEFQTLCPKGMGHNDVGEDLNECVLIPNICRGGECINTDGSFRCDCPVGFRLHSSGTECVDDDECVSNPTICGNGNCTNLVGSFECVCDVGFVSGPNRTCEDVNECSDYSHQCAFRCHNTYGSYRCTCPDGYQLTDDGRHCQDVNECSISSHLCNYECKNTIGSYLCQCPVGFVSTTNSEDQCVDKNECLESGVCAGGRCVNLDGGYRCECDKEFKPSPDGKQCIDDRTGYCYRSHNLLRGRCVHYNVSSKQISRAECCCTMGAAWGPTCHTCPKPSTPEYQQLCPSTGMNMSGYDIDECTTMPDICLNGRCMNTVGSYWCTCNKGYKNDHSGTKCVDINECLLAPPLCQMTCENTDGGYNCGCVRGYTLSNDNSSCRDIDECAAGTHICQQICTNTKGSYECACNPGYKKIRNSCSDIDECSQAGVCPAPGNCTNTVGSYRCLCPKGMKLDSTNSCTVASESPKGPNGSSNDQNGLGPTNSQAGRTNNGGTGQNGLGPTNSQAGRTNNGGTSQNGLGPTNSQAGHTNNGGTGQNGLGPTNSHVGPTNNGGTSQNKNGNDNGGSNPNGNSNVPDSKAPDNKDGSHQGPNSVANHTLGPNGNGNPIPNHGRGAKGNQSDNSAICKNGKCVSQLCPVGFTKHPDHNECVDNNECLQSPCGSSQCINSVGSYQCICADGFFYDDTVSDCVQMEGGCADSPCTSGCTLLDLNDYVCGCPTGYQLIGPGHCFYTALNTLPSLNQVPNLGDNILTYPINGDSNTSNIISTEGCFSCKVINHHQWVRSRPHIKLTMTYEQIMKKTYILNLQPSTRDSHSEYILADSEDARFFNLQKKNQVWTLYLMAPERRKETIVFHVGILDKMSRDSFELHLELAIVPETIR